MGDGVTDGGAEGEEQHTTDDVEGDTKDNVTDDPAVVEGSHNQNELGDDVDDGHDQGVNEIGDEETDRVVVVERAPLLERAGSNDEADAADAEAAEAQRLEGSVEWLVTGPSDLLTQRLIGVPSSYSWKPTKPLTRMHQ